MERSTSGIISLVDSTDDGHPVTKPQGQEQSDETELIVHDHINCDDQIQDEDEENHNKKGSCGRCESEPSVPPANEDRFRWFYTKSPNNDQVLRIFDEVDQEYKPIYVHRATLLMRSPYFERILGLDSSQAEMTIQLDGYRFLSYMIYLQYIYTSYLDSSKESLFEVYQLVSDLAPEDEELIKQLRDFRDLSSAEELCDLYMFYTVYGSELYRNYNHEKMREFFEDYIWLLINIDDCDHLLEVVRDTPLAAIISEFKEKYERASRIPESVPNETYYTQELKNWPIFFNFPQALLYSIDKFYVYNSGRSVLVITDNDRVFAYGENEDGELGVGHRYNVSMPEEVVELSGKLVISIVSDLGYVMALTLSGDLYAFGLNNKAQLGVGNFDDQLRPVLVMSRVKMVSCVGDHTLALDFDQHAWNWGSDEDSYDSEQDHLEPVKTFKFEFCNNKKIMHVACGRGYSLAVTDDQQVFVWGKFGEFYQPTRYRIPHLIYDRPGFQAKSVLAFRDNFLILSSKGLVYLVRFYHGFVFEPLVSVGEPVEEMYVSTNTSSRIFAILLGQSGMLYQLKHNVYPDCHEVKPIWHRSLADAFCKEHCNITPVLTRFSPHLLDPNRNQVVKMFNQNEDSDFALKVNCEFIYLHRSVLRQRSSHLANLLDTEWKDKCMIEINDPLYPVSVYLHYFRYLYSGSWEFEQQDMKTVIGLYYLAQLYHNSKLKNRCEQFIILTLVATPAYKLKGLDWFKLYFEVVIQLFALLTTKYSKYFSLDKCLRLFERVPVLRRTLLPFLSQRKSQLAAEPFYESMEITSKSDLEMMIDSDEFQLDE